MTELYVEEVPTIPLYADVGSRSNASNAPYD
jgi:hypothetical protein